MKENNFFKGIISCLIAGIVFGAQWPVAGSALNIVDPYWFTLLRYLIVAVVLTVILAFTEGKAGFTMTVKQGWGIWLLGTMAFCAYNFLVFAGQRMAGTQGTLLASLLMALIPMVSVLVLWGLKRQFPGWLTLGLILVSLLGVFLVVTKGDLTIFSQDKALLIPIGLIFLSVFAWVFYTIGGSAFSKWSSLKYTTLSCILGNISSVIVILVLNHFQIAHTPSLHAIQTISWQLIYMSVFSGVIGVLMWNVGNKLLTPQNGALFMNLVPIVTFMIEVITGYHISGVELLGVFLTIVAIVLNNISKRISRPVMMDEEVLEDDGNY